MTISGCARCGEAHQDLEWFAFQNPVAPPEMAPFQWTHWAKCPVTGDPLLQGTLTQPHDDEALQALAERAYDAYASGVQQRPELGAAREWSGLEDDIQAAWRAAVKAVLR